MEPHWMAPGMTSFLEAYTRCHAKDSVNFFQTGRRACFPVWMGSFPMDIILSVPDIWRTTCVYSINLTFSLNHYNHESLRQGQGNSSPGLWQHLQIEEEFHHIGLGLGLRLARLEAFNWNYQSRQFTRIWKHLLQTKRVGLGFVSLI